jgi:hypothetical protein
MVGLDLNDKLKINKYTQNERSLTKSNKYMLNAIVNQLVEWHQSKRK